MWKFVVTGAVILAIVLFGFSMIDATAGDQVSASTVLSDTGADISGFARAVEPLDWEFPRNFGPHPEYQTEWWYYTGNLKAANGDHFGFQFTVFRRAIDPESPQGESEWRSNQLYMAHFAVTDVARQRFFHEERYSRAGAGLAGASVHRRGRAAAVGQARCDPDRQGRRTEAADGPAARSGSPGSTPA